MGYPLDLDEYTGQRLVGELAYRAAARADGNCDYCTYPLGVPIKTSLLARMEASEEEVTDAQRAHVDRLKDDGVCRFPRRHANEEGLTVTEQTLQERARQHLKWGQQDWPDGTGPDGWLFEDFQYARLETLMQRHNDDQVSKGLLTWTDILLEEVFEALCETEPEKLKAELTQIAAVAESWVESIDRRTETEN